MRCAVSNWERKKFKTGRFRAGQTIGFGLEEYQNESAQAEA
jgi:hypothetical protein